MGTVWFCLIAFMLTVYVVLDGFDIGAGIVHLAVARTAEERRTILRSIGPVWDANEVWLIAAGGTLYLAFPGLYASSFSGFYLPLIMVLWLLILRGISVEFRSSFAHPVWIAFWDGIFALSSVLLAVFFGVALGNVVRGVALDPAQRFFEPLWTNFRPEVPTGILDWYTVLVGLLALVALAVHGCAWIAFRTDGETAARAGRLLRRLWWGVVVLTVLVTWFSWDLQPQITHNLHSYPWGWILPALAIGGLVLTWRWSGRRPLATFLASAAYLAGMLASVAFGLYPYVLPARSDPSLSLSIENTRAPDAGLRLALAWWAVGMVLVAFYFWMLYRRMAGRAGHDESHGY
jgi:cytochrome d ubiquinol oxidase subunit II